MVAYADNPKSSAQKLRTILSGGLKDFKSSLSKKALPSDLAQEIVVAISRELEKFLTDMHVETCDQVSGRIQKKINSLDPMKVFFTDDVMAKLKETFADDEYRQSILDVLQGINPDAKIEDVKAKASGKAEGEGAKQGDNAESESDNGFSYDEKQFAEFLDKVLPKVKFFDDIILRLSDQITESLKDIKVMSDELIKSNHKLAVSNIQLAMSNLALKTANLSLSAANLSLSAANLQLAASNITLAVSNVALSVSNFALAAAKLVLAASNIVLAVSNIALAITVITTTISLMVTVITAMVAVVTTVFSAAAAVVVTVFSAVAAVVATVFAATLSVVAAIAGLIISAAGVALSIVGLALSVFASAAVIAVAVIAAAALLAVTAVAVGGALVVTALAVGGALIVAAGLIAIAAIAVAGVVSLVAAGLVTVAVALAFGVATMLAGAILATGVLLAGVIAATGVLLAGTALIIAAMMMVVLLPISLAVTAILAVVVGIVALIVFGFLLAKDKIEEMIKWVTDWWEKSWFKQQIDEIQQVGLWEWFKQKLEASWAWIKNIAGALADWWKGTAIYQWWNSENKWSTLWDTIYNGLKSAFSWMVSFGEWLTNFGKKVCEAFADWWKDSDLKKSWDGLVDKFQKFSLSETLSNLVSKLSNGIKKLLAPLADFSINLPTGFKWKDMSILKWNFKIPVGLEWKTIQPFASFAEEKPAEISQVSAAPELGQTLNSIDNGEQEGKQELANTTQEVKTQMNEETAAQQFKEDGRFKTMLDRMDELNAGMAQRNRTEYVPAPIVVQGGGELAWENR